ncbi:MAG: dihydrolipoamide acetyltransferase family protein [Acidimicrobiia bacterium]
MADVTMPQLGETVTEGTITRWFKQVGDQVAADEVLFEVSTDKVDSEVPSPAAGYLTEIKVPEGETVDVGVVLAVIGDAPAGGGAGAEPAAAEAEPVAAEAEPAAPGPAQPEPAAESRPAPAEPAPEGVPSPAPAAAVEPTAPPGPPPAPPAPGPSPATPGAGKLLSPVVRRLVAEHGLDTDRIQGTGAGGRITRNDVLAVIEAGGTRPVPASPPEAASAPAAPAESAPAAAPAGAPPAAPAAAAPAAGAPAPPAAAAVRPGARDTAVPYSNIRRRTAEHMTRSKATSAHAYVSSEVDFEVVETVRRSVRAAWKEAEGFSLTYLPFIARAVVDAIAEFPEVNSTMGESDLIVHHDVNLGIAVDLDYKGLMVPVVQGADTKRLRAIAREISDLAGRARSKKLGPDDIAGGTFTITNPGPFGTTMTLPIISQPQVAILSTDAVKRRPVVVDLDDGSEAITIHSVGNLTLTWDHRAFDGAYAAGFLRRLKELVETRDWAAEL